MGSKYTPTRDNVLPTAVWERLPKSERENVSFGCQIANWMPMGEIVQVYNISNPYDVMNAFAASRFVEQREATRVLGNTPCNRFFFQLKDGSKVYEIVERNGTKVVVESAWTPKRGEITWKNVSRRKVQQQQW